MTPFRTAVGRYQAIGSSFYPHDAGDTLVSAIDVYIDDSDTLQRGGFVCFAGYAMAGTKWHDFAVLWHAKAVEHELPGAYLHTSDFLSGRGIYSDLGLTMENRVEVIRDFLRLIHKHVSLAIGVSVDAMALQEIAKRKHGPKLSALVFLLARYLHLLQVQSQKLAITFSAYNLICDAGESSKALIGAFMELKRAEKFVAENAASIAFADDRFYQPLQTADLFACLLAKEERRIRDGEQQIYGSLGELLDSTGVGQVTAYVGERVTREALQEHGEALYEGLQKLLGRSA